MIMIGAHFSLLRCLFCSAILVFSWAEENIVVGKSPPLVLIERDCRDLIKYIDSGKAESTDSLIESYHPSSYFDANRQRLNGGHIIGIWPAMGDFKESYVDLILLSLANSPKGVSAQLEGIINRHFKGKDVYVRFEMVKTGGDLSELKRDMLDSIKEITDLQKEKSLIVGYLLLYVSKSLKGTGHLKGDTPP